MSAVRIADGGYSFDLGVDSGRLPTTRSQTNPNGLQRGMLAWLSNGTVRGGGITQRYGWNKLCTVSPGNVLYNGGYLYEPTLSNPYLMLSIGGRIFQVRVDTDNSVHDITGGTPNASTPQAYFCQGEQFLVIQSGDWAMNNAGTLPLFWDGTTLRRSVGIISPNNVPGTSPLGQLPYNELPAALAMTYFQGRIWYANGRKYTAGDIVDGPSGTVAPPYLKSDSVLKVTENPLALGGDGFTVPSSAGPITALTYTAQLDATLGQGNLYIFTRRQVNSLVVPVSRANWIAASGSNQPQQLVALTKWGTPSERSIIKVNGDLFYVSMEPAIRSLIVATRYFSQPGNTPISRNVQRALDFTNPILLGLSPGINFDNRALFGVLPITTPVGTAYQGLVALNFDGISTLQEKTPPAWEGVLEGLNILQLFEGDFGGVQRAFALVCSQLDQSIQVWELTTARKTENGDNRIQWRMEFPAYTWNKEFDLKKLDGAELWLDRLSGTVQITAEYRADADPCWNPWFSTQFCAARSTCENMNQPVCYPVQPYCEGNKFPLTFPSPDATNCSPMNARPSNVGYQFQMRLTIKGFCRVRGLLMFALPVDKTTFGGLPSSCAPSQPVNSQNFSNVAQSCTVTCSDGLPFTFTCPAGVFTSTTQGDANAQANSYACQQAALRLICLSDIAPNSVNIGQPYTGLIIATGGELETGSQENNWQLTPGSILPPGLQFNGGMIASNQVSVTGTPTLSGAYPFGVTLTDPQGNVMTKQFVITVGCAILTQVTNNQEIGGDGRVPWVVFVPTPPYNSAYRCVNNPPVGSVNILEMSFISPTPKTWPIELTGNGDMTYQFFVNGVLMNTFSNSTIFTSITTNNCVPVDVKVVVTVTIAGSVAFFIWQSQ